MASYDGAMMFACGEDAEPPPRPARRSTSGQAPPPPPQAPPAPPARHGWQGAKPPPALLRADIADRIAKRELADEESTFSDDEDFIRGGNLKKRLMEQAKAQAAAGAADEHEDEEDEGEDDDDEAEEWTTEMPKPMFSPIAVAPTPSTSPSLPSSSTAAVSNVSELMESAVREAFKQGIEQGKRMQLPMLCKTCAIRKERNRIAAKEARLRKREAAEASTRSRDIRRAAEEVARKATEAEESPVPPPF